MLSKSLYICCCLFVVVCLLLLSWFVVFACGCLSVCLFVIVVVCLFVVVPVKVTC